MQIDTLPGITASLAGAIGTLTATLLVGRGTRRGFEREQRATAKRLASGGVTWGDLEGGNVRPVGRGDGESHDKDNRPDADAQERDDQFASVLIEYYSYGLTQARRSFYTSQVISAIGVFVILFGVVLAIWRAETSGDMFASIVTSCSGVVSTVVGQLVHRRADIALKHMADQTDSLRSDMSVERASEQAIALLAEVTDHEVKTRLQAGLIMKLSGSEMPEIGSLRSGATAKVPEQSAQ